MSADAAAHGGGAGESRSLYLIKIAGIAAAYYGAARLGLDLAFTTESVTAVWAPTGIALAAVLLWGYRVLPGVALGAFLANVWTDVPLYTALGITVGNTLEALVGAYLLRRVADFRPTLERVRDVVALAVFGGVISTMVSATIGIASLLVGDVIASGDLASVWRTWWLGDMGGDFVVAPALLVLATHWPYDRRAPGRWLEALGLALLIGGVTALVFTREASLTFLILPPLIVAAFRFWQPGAVAGALLVACIAIPLTANELGPFSDISPDDRLLLAQALVGVASLTVLVLAAVLTERGRVEYTLARIAGTLQESLLPSRVPEIPGMEMAIDFRPAGEGQIVGGDFYDAYPGDDGSWTIVVGDVLGKGPGAAATTALARYTLRAAAMHERRPSRILGELNRAIKRQTPGQSCTVAYSRLELDGGRARITLSSGGHPLPLVLRAYGGVELAGNPGNILGVEDDPLLEDDVVELAPADALVFYTDGLTDAHAPSRIVSLQDLAIALRDCAGCDASQIVGKLTHSLLDSHPGEPRDDILLFVLRLPPAGAPRASEPTLRGTDSSLARPRAS